MRYAGQGWEIPVTLDEDSTFDQFAAELLSSKFTKAYEEFFGRAIDDLAIETVSWSVRVSSVMPPRERVELSGARRVSAPPPDSHREAYDARPGRTVATALYSRVGARAGAHDRRARRSSPSRRRRPSSPPTIAAPPNRTARC